MTAMLLLVSAPAFAQTFDQIVQDHDACQRHHLLQDLQVGTRYQSTMTVPTSGYETGWEWCTAQEQTFTKALTDHVAGDTAATAARAAADAAAQSRNGK